MADKWNPKRIARRPLLLAIAALLWLVASGALARALEIRSIVLTVSDLDRSVAFYQTALGFTKVSERLIAERDHDYAVGVEVDDIEGVVADLTRANAGFISPGVVTAPAMAVEKCALVKDPDGHAVMLVQGARPLAGAGVGGDVASHASSLNGRDR